MAYRYSLLCFAALLALSASAEAQVGGNRQDPYASRILLGPESYTWQSARGPVQQASHTTARHRTPVNRTQAKPFNTVVNQPTVSPYMNLYRDQTAVDIPNYHMFVVPQQQQLETNARQQRVLNQMQQRVNQASHIAPTGNSPYSRTARYGDTSHYYPGLNR